tara:strand:- start:20868 stop:21692 length:825 start_codon:yes stop_codon:yes gene_type:complete
MVDLNFKYDIYVTTYNRYAVFERNLQYWLDHTPNDLTINIAYDDDNNDYYADFMDNPRIWVWGQEEGERQGARGNWEKCIKLSQQKILKPDYVVVFQDDCYPTTEAWLKDLDNFLVQSKERHPFIQFVPTPPDYMGHYDGVPLAICDQTGVMFRNEEQFGHYIVQDVTIDSFVFSCIKLKLLEDEDHITDEWFGFYGNWHSELQMKLVHKEKIPWRSTHLKNLEFSLLAMDFRKDTVRELEKLGGGMKLKEKHHFVKRNRVWESSPKWIENRWK